MWDERYSTEDYAYGTQPNDFLAEQFACIPAGGRVLCLADGEGRNGVFLAQQGYEVTSVDLSRVGLEKAARLAEDRGVSLHTVHADLAEFDPGNAQWDGIVSIFCHLPGPVRQKLYPQIPASLTAGGVFLLEAYTPAQLAHGTGGPKDADMLMTAEKLQAELPALHFSLLREVERNIVEGSYHTGIASVVQAIARR
ncbi:MAG: class I SAM-dependent methyltransferase [Pseudomonadales bacterium]|nr:class I SAM-dependent methyltransferase [Pseudomonadales bacterium]MCP5356509.1 class I SAM-dependent methyltransferase [Pseudomonadales bacterium]